MASRPRRACTQPTEFECNWDEEEEEFVPDQESFENTGTSKKRGRGEPEPMKKSQRSTSRVTYREASSDDEFAQQHFILPTADKKKSKKTVDEDMYFQEESDEEAVELETRKKKDKKSKQVNADDEDEEMGDEIEYRIQHILGRKAMTPAQWRSMNENYTTVEVTKGSVWQQPDEEYYDTSDVPLEKFLIKWAHASYLHVSWETEKDLMDNVGPSAKIHIKRFRMREYEGRELFEDLSKAEFFPFNYIQIERILDVDDPEVNMYSVDWESAALPPFVAVKKNSIILKAQRKEDPASIPETSNEPIQEELAVEIDVPEPEKAETSVEEPVSEETTAEKPSEMQVASENPQTEASSIYMNLPKLEDIQDTVSLYYIDNNLPEPENVEFTDDWYIKEYKKILKEKGIGQTTNKEIKDEEEVQFVPRRSTRSAKRRVSNLNEEDDEQLIEAPKKGIHKHIVRGKKQKLSQYLHGEKCYVTVKWEGLPYADVSFELLDDIINRGIEYETALRRFYKREQKSLYSEAQKKNSARKLILDQNIIGTNSAIPEFPGGSLRDYQWEGVRWMLFNLVQGRNCILADEMGLGKTIQSSALLQMVKNHQKSAGPFLVVAPLSTIVNWQREVSTWTYLDVIMYYGSQEDRELIRSYEFKYLDSKNPGYKVEVVITTPETCVAYDDKTNGSGKFRRELSKIPWDLIIVDEAHKLKNYDSKLSSTLRDEYTFKNCVLLTGTPLQNNTDELWSLLNFVAEDDFADREAFIEQFGELKSSEQLDALHKRIKPYLLRREKEHVEKTVPPKEEIVIEVELTIPQKQYYRAIYEQKTGFLYKSGAKDGPSLTNLAMELRKCCNHPFLIKGAQNELSKHFSNSSEHDILTQTSGKMTLLDKLLPKLQKDGHRVLIFSQFRMMLDLIEDYLHGAGYCYERVDGSIVGKQRQAAIDRYMANDHIFAMLLSTKAGGVGINLTAADTVIIFDSDWNPQNDIQAQARAHRIGQTKSVTVYRLLTKKTYEMVMFKAASIKLGLDYAVMHNLGNSEIQMPTMGRGRGRRGGSAAAASALAGISSEKAEHVSSLSKKELENLLKHGAYDMFLEDREGKGDDESKKFVEESIEQILERSSVFTHKEDEKERKCQNKASFAKASFVSASTENGEDQNEVAIDDPDFWTKVIGLSVEEEQDGINGKRKCRQLIDSYREPTESIKSIYGSIYNARVTDSEESDASKKERKRRKKSNELVPAEFTSENLQSIFNALLNHGYGNWDQIRKVTKLRWFSYDIAKACRLGILNLLLLSSCVCESADSGKSNSETANFAEEEVNDENKPNETLQRSDSSPKVVGSIVFDSALLLQNLKKFKLSKFALKLYVDYDIDVESVDSQNCDEIQFAKLLNELQQLCEKDSLINSRWKDVFDRQLFTNQLLVDESEVSLKKVIDMVQGIPDLATFFVFESDPVKIQKRTMNSRGKLAQLEDLFEAMMFVKLSDAINPPNNDVVDSTLKVTTTETSDQVMQEEDNNHEGINIEEAIAIKIPPVLTMPSSMEKLLDIAENSIPSWWCKMYDSALMQSVVKYGWPEGKRKLSGIMDQLGQLTPNDGSSEAMTSLLTPKFVLNRLKALCRHMRYSEEDVAAAAKIVAVAKANAKQQMKKNATNVLKIMQRIGYPRGSYESIITDLSTTVEDNEKLFERCNYLLTWETFAKECNMVENIADLKQIVYSAVEAFNNESETENVTVGVLEEIPMKLVKAAFDKSDLIHHIRLTLALNSEMDIHHLIDENCKGTGPNVPIFRRDMTMPVWWTQAHDVMLLRLCLSYGYGQWKTIIVDPLVNTAPEDFVIPPKVNGTEWALQLTVKTAEKRVLALLRGMPQLKNIPLPPPSSPQKKGSVQQVSSLPTVNKKSMFWFQQQKATSSSDAPAASASAPVPSSPKNNVEVSVSPDEEREMGDNIIKSIPLTDSIEVEIAEKTDMDVASSEPVMQTASGSSSPPPLQCTGDSYIEVLNSVRDSAAPEEAKHSESVIDITNEIEVVANKEIAKPEVSVNDSKYVEPEITIVEKKSEIIVIATPSKPEEAIEGAKDLSTLDDCSKIETSLQTPKNQVVNTEKKAKKAEKAPPKPVNNGKSIMSFFKKVRPTEGTA